jgi:hypothetical protein
MRILPIILILVLAAGCAPHKDVVTEKPSIVRTPSEYCINNPDTPICNKKPVAKEQ